MISFSIQRLLFLRPCRLRFLFFCLPFFAFVLTYVSSVLSKIPAQREEGKFLVNPNANRLFTLPRKRKRLAHRFAIFHVHHDWKDSPRYDTITARAGEKQQFFFWHQKHRQFAAFFSLSPDSRRASYTTKERKSGNNKQQQQQEMEK